jgi:hypothetical protein
MVAEAGNIQESRRREISAVGSHCLKMNETEKTNDFSSREL